MCKVYSGGGLGASNENKGRQSDATVIFVTSERQKRVSIARARAYENVRCTTVPGRKCCEKVILSKLHDGLRDTGKSRKCKGL